ncbi:MAG: amidohydrolase family protein [Woeseiaceae bacterium]
MHRWLTVVSLFVVMSSVVAAEEKKDWSVEKPGGEPFEVNIDVDEGTWMSLDVSPDDRFIVFDLLGDIYRVPAAGGDAEVLHSGVSWSMQPRYSPDGETIAFTSDAGGADNLWLMNSDGSKPRQLTNERFRLLNNPAWSADGQYIAARKHFTTQRSLGTGEIWMYHTNGGSGVRVTKKPSDRHQKEIGEPVFSPDGQYLYYSRDSTSGPSFQYAQDSNGEIFRIDRVDMRTGEVSAFVTGAGGAVRPQPSPDGKSLAFVRRERAKSHLFIKDLESGRVRKLYEPLDQDLQEIWAVHGVYPNFDWTSDSSEIVIWAGGKIRRINVSDGSAAIVPFRVTDTRTVHRAPRPKVDVAPAQFDAKMVRSAEVSPDGKSVVFESAGRLYTKTLPDGQPKRLTTDRERGFEFFPSWSPDSRQIVFVSWEDNRLGQIRTVRATGGRSKTLSISPGHFRHPRFSPSGDHIVFTAERGGYLTNPDWSETTGVMLMPAIGGAASLISESGAYPHFGRNDERVFVVRGGRSSQQLVSVDLNGFDERVHATTTFARRLTMAPDEKHILFRENYHVYVAPMPPGGEPLALSPKAGAVPLNRVTGDGGNYAHWSPDGQVLYWSLGSTLMSAPIAELLAKSDGKLSYTAPESGVSLAVRHESDVPDGMVALAGAKLITMSGVDGGIVEDGVILIDGNRIQAVGSRDSVTIPETAKVIDVSSRTIIPGLIDAHAHGGQGDDIIPQQNWVNYATLSLGVTTIHDPSNDATEIFAAAEMQRTGAILAPRIFSTGDIVYGAKSAFFADINTAEDAAEHVRRLKAQGAVSIKNYNQPRREQRQQVAAAARDENMLVVAEGGSLFHMDLSMVADGNSGIEHNLPQSVLYEDVIQFWSQTDVSYTPTLVVTFGGPPAERYWYQHTEVWKHPILSKFVPPNILQPRSVRREMAPDADYFHIVSARTSKQLADAGVAVSIGAHGQREGLASHWEMWGFAQGGMSAIEALATATTQPARHLGMADDIGSIEVGKLADLVVIDADISEDIFKSDKVSLVMLNGRLYDAATMNEMLTGERETAPMYWQDQVD